MLNIDFEKMKEKVYKTSPLLYEGRVSKIIGLTIEVEGLRASIGELSFIYNQQNNPI